VTIVGDAGWDKDAIIARSGRDSLGDLALGGPLIVEREPRYVFEPGRFSASARVAPADDMLKEEVRREAGWRDMAPGP